MITFGLMINCRKKAELKNSMKGGKDKTRKPGVMWTQF
jgi:hypothetical protein